MKLLFIISTLDTGGAQKVLSNLVLGMPDEYEIDILLNDTDSIVYPYKGTLISLGLKKQDNKQSILYQFKVLIKRIVKLKKLKKTKNYTAVISFLDSANVANILTGNKHCKTILTVHSNLTQSASLKIYRYLVNPVVKCLYGRADKVIAVSKGIAYDLIHNLKLSPYNIKTIYNGHDIDQIRRMAEERAEVFQEKDNVASPVIATMGRMSYPKGQWHLIRALKKVKESFPDIRLLILGDGELQAEQWQLVEECGLEEQVLFCGFLNNPFSVLAKCDAFVLPSMYEGFSNALIEALACGLPCLATDFKSSSREILAPELPIEGDEKPGVYKASYGIITPVCDGKWRSGEEELTKEEELLASGICMLLKDEKLCRIYQDKAEDAIKNLDVKQMIEQWIKVINE